MRTLKTLGLALSGISIIGIMMTGCAGRQDTGYANKDGTTVATRSDDPPTNYGSGDNGLDRQADENHINLYKLKTSF